MSKTSIVRIIVAFVGFISIIIVFWVASVFKWSSTTQIVIALLIALASILVEMIISMDKLKESIERIYPALELSLEEQRTINNTIILCNQLKKKIDDPAGRIALSAFDKVNYILNQAVKGSDFIYNDIFEANMVTLKGLKPGQTFKGLSALIKPEYWKNGKAMNEYREVNYSQAKMGVNIERIFLLNTEKDLELMTPIIKDQSEHGIRVYYLLKNTITEQHVYPDFSVVSELRFALVVHREDMLERVTVTTNEETVSEIENQFDKLKHIAIEFKLKI